MCFHRLKFLYFSIPLKLKSYLVIKALFRLFDTWEYLTASNKVFRDKAFQIAKIPKYDGYQTGLCAMYKLHKAKCTIFLIRNRFLLLMKHELTLILKISKPRIARRTTLSNKENLIKKIKKNIKCTFPVKAIVGMQI